MRVLDSNSRTVDVSGFGKYLKRVAMDGDGDGSGDMREVEGVPLRQLWMSGLLERARLFSAGLWLRQ
jgi:hypothetical protein